MAGREISTPAGRSWVQRAAESLFFTLFPSDCRLCGEPQLNVSRLPVCPECLARIHPIRGKVCSICGERVFSAYAASDPSGQRRCPVCRRAARPFARAAAYGSYDGELRGLIHLLKYDGVRPAAGVLGRVLGETIAAMEPAFERGTVMVIPVPLYKTKRRQRGFNQAELIALSALKVAGSKRLQLATGVLLRTRETESQIGLTAHARRENLRGAFAVPRTAEVTGRDVLLVDDVYTTGTTVSECARVLRRAGAAQVWVATVARTLKLASQLGKIEPEEVEEEGSKVSEFQGFEGEGEAPVESGNLETLKP
ncbi:MAG TPA: ComF family protein [Candidatus Sulfotelmatobacter sp.]|nr:ComF family protein [Candidatus Sulfotelmatobacter sp.]